jgi:hypothetical protein
MDALFTEHCRTMDNAAGDWAQEASFEAAFGGSPCHERDDCIGHCPTCREDSGPVYIDCGCVAAGRPGLDVRGDVCPYCYGETRHELPF